jgi:hypothetical protein
VRFGQNTIEDPVGLEDKKAFPGHLLPWRFGEVLCRDWLREGNKMDKT